MKKTLYFVASASFYIAAISFLTVDNNIAAVLNLFSGTIFLVLAIKH